MVFDACRRRHDLHNLDPCKIMGSCVCIIKLDALLDALRTISRSVLLHNTNIDRGLIGIVLGPDDFEVSVLKF